MQPSSSRHASASTSTGHLITSSSSACAFGLTSYFLSRSALAGCYANWPGMMADGLAMIMFERSIFAKQTLSRVLLLCLGHTIGGRLLTSCMSAALCRHLQHAGLHHFSALIHAVQCRPKTSSRIGACAEETHSWSTWRGPPQ